MEPSQLSDVILEDYGPEFDYLPTEFQYAHQYCFHLHNQLVETLISAEEAQVFHITLEFDDPEQYRELDGLLGEDLYAWMMQNGFESDALLLEYKQLTAALLSDFLHFVYEALQCSAKGKLTVAYALLRKPLKENLFYFEWLLADPEEFMHRFTQGLVEEIAIPGSLSREERVRIIQEATSKTQAGDWLPSDFIYSLRYNKKSEYGLEMAWQKATHLVTTMGTLRTEKANLNFVFSNEEAQYSQWDHLYLVLPLLLFHAVQVIEALLATFATREHADYDLVPLRNMLGLHYWMMRTRPNGVMEDYLKQLVDGLNMIGMACPKCGCEYSVGSDHLERFWITGILECPHCHHEMDLQATMIEALENEDSERE